jgi:hypothetical protein
VIEAFEKMQSTTTATYVVLQMQATSISSGAKVIVPSIATLSDASSPLRCTKGLMDPKTNPRILANAATRIPKDKLLTLLNDFVETPRALRWR